MLIDQEILAFNGTAICMTFKTNDSDLDDTLKKIAERGEKIANSLSISGTIVSPSKSSKTRI